MDTSFEFLCINSLGEGQKSKGAKSALFKTSRFCFGTFETELAVIFSARFDFSAKVDFEFSPLASFVEIELFSFVESSYEKWLKVFKN